MTDLVCKNGIQLRINESDKFARNMLSVSFITPLDENASANCLLAAVMGRGCKKYPEINNISDFLDTHYGATFTLGTGKKGENQVIRFSISYIDQKYIDDTFDIEKDMLSFLSMMISDTLLDNEAITKERTETERKNIIDSIKAGMNDKTTYANLRCASIMFENEAYGIDSSGSIEGLRKISYKDLPEALIRLIKSSKIIVFGLGRFNKINLIHWTETLFDPILPGFISNAAIRKTMIIPVAESVKRVEEKDSVTQSKLVMGFRTGSSGYMHNIAGYALFNVIFSTAPCSRLFVNVREKQSLCYYCASTFDRHKGIMFVYSGISSENRDLVEKAILEQIKNISEEIYADEFEQAKKILIDSIMQAEDSPTAMESRYLNAVIGNEEISADEYIRLITAAKTEDVSLAAKSLSLDTVFFLRGADTADNTDNEGAEYDF